MAQHPLDHIIASEFTQAVIEKRNREMEHAFPVFHKPHQVARACIFDAVPDDRPSIADGFQGEGFNERQRLILG